MAEPVKLCLWCTHCSITDGSEGYCYSEYTSDETHPFEIECALKHFKVDYEKVSDGRLQKNLLTAMQCPDYTEDPNLIALISGKK